MTEAPRLNLPAAEADLMLHMALVEIGAALTPETMRWVHLAHSLHRAFVAAEIRPSCADDALFAMDTARAIEALGLVFPATTSDGNPAPRVVAGMSEAEVTVALDQITEGRGR